MDHPDVEWTDILKDMNAKDIEALRTFFAHNENVFKGHVLPTHTMLDSLYADLDRAAKDVILSLKEDFDPTQSQFVGVG